MLKVALPSKIEKIRFFCERLAECVPALALLWLCIQYIETTFSEIETRW